MVLCVTVPLSPVTVTVYVPTVPLHDSVEFAEGPRLMVVGLSEHVRPVVGASTSVRAMFPVKPSTGDTVIVDVPVVPETGLTPVGDAVILKLGPVGIVTSTLMMTVWVWVEEPSVAVPVMTTV